MMSQASEITGSICSHDKPTAFVEIKQMRTLSYLKISSSVRVIVFP